MLRPGRRTAVAAIAAVCAALPFVAHGEDPPKRSEAFRRDVAEFLDRWCISCHLGKDAEDGFDLGPFRDEGHARGHPRGLREIREKLVEHEMPPADEPQPPAAARRAAADWISAALRSGRPAKPSANAESPAPAPTADPGRVVLRRLSREEYVRTVRDLLAVDVVTTDDFPADDLGYGFDNVGDVNTVSPLLVEKYARAAERIAAEAVVDLPSPAAVRVEAESLPHGDGAGPMRDWLVLMAAVGVQVRFDAPCDGTYVLRARTFGQRAGPDLPRVGWKADDRPAGECEVTATRREPGLVESSARLARGPHAITLAFLNDYFQPDAKDPNDRDRNVAVDWIEIEGPFDAAPPPVSHRRIFAADPGGTDRAARARAVLRPLASRAWRRPASDDEVARLAALATSVKERSFERGIAVALQAILVSPHFVFRVEKGGDARPLDGWEIATRLSYFLWSSLPDESLAAAARSGALATPDGVEAQVRRMLRDPRATSLATNFAAQWLELRGLATVAPDPARFPQFDDDLRRSMRAETELFFEAVLREGRDVSELLVADWSFLDERLARHYGVPGVSGPQMRRVPLGGLRPGGILGHASFHTVTSNPTRTSPVKRGKWILDHLLASPPAPPTPGKDSFAGGEASLRDVPIRVQMERHRADPGCAPCHRRMDVLGLAVEHYDAVGARRATDGKFEIDATGTLPDGRKIDGVDSLAAALASGDGFVRALAKKLFIVGVGRPPRDEDEPLFDDIAESLPAGRRTIESVIVAIARSDAFRTRAADAAQGGPK